MSGRGPPCGELLRRYWFPVAVAQDLTEEQPTKLIRLLGEDLVLFRDRSGRVGLLADHCSHRGASLLYGRVEERGLACAYNGWLYDTEGKFVTRLKASGRAGARPPPLHRGTAGHKAPPYRRVTNLRDERLAS